MTPMTMKPPHPLTTELREALLDPAVLAVWLEHGNGPVEATLRRVDRELRTLPETWGAVKAAQYMGVRHNNLYKMKGLPKPIESEDPRGQRWLASDIRAWKKRRGGH